MVTLPPPFTATRLPGYFWNTETQTLFSIKQGGALRELKFKPANYWNRNCAGYQVSHKGIKRYMTLDYLKTLTLKDSEIGIAHTYNGTWAR